MADRVRVGVMGAGAIGSYVGGMLAATGDADVVLVGRSWLRDEIAACGLTVRAFGGAGRVVDADRIAVDTEPGALAGCDAVLCCVKSAHTADAARALAGVVAPGAVVASLQNGLRNADALRAELSDRRVVAGIVGFNVVAPGGGVFQRTTDGPLMLEACDEPRWRRVVDALASAGLDVAERADIVPDQWTKLLINLNNAVSALSGAPTRDLILTAGYRRIVSAVVGEGVRVVKAAGIRPARFRGVPIGLMPRMLRLPSPVVRVLARAQMKVDPEARSSMWADLERRRPTEVDYLNGEIVALADRAGIDAPLNRRIVALVRDAERAGAGSPQLLAEQLWSALTRADESASQK